MITYLDIAVRGRPTSDTPERTVEAMATLFGLTVPGSGGVWPSGSRASARSPGMPPAFPHFGYGVVTAPILHYLYRRLSPEAPPSEATEPA